MGKNQLLHNRVYSKGERDVWVRCWSEGRGRNKEFIVQIWDDPNAPAKDAKPDHDWAMPSWCGLAGAIDQAVIQSYPNRSQ